MQDLNQKLGAPEIAALRNAGKVQGRVGVRVCDIQPRRRLSLKLSLSLPPSCSCFLNAQSGNEIIEELCSNSSTFESKTEFSQDKYKRKKAKKYIVYVTVRRPTARAICQVSVTV